MVGRSKWGSWSFLLTVALLAASCSSLPPVQKVDLRSLGLDALSVPAREDSTDLSALHLAVPPLHDQRARPWIGTWASTFGTETLLMAEGHNVGTMIAEVLIAQIKRQRGWNVWLSRPGVHPPHQGPDLILSGTVQDCHVHVHPYQGGEMMDATVRLTLRLSPPGSHAAQVMTIDERESRSSSGFEVHDVETELRTLIEAGMEKALAQMDLDASLRLTTP